MSEINTIRFFQSISASKVDAVRKNAPACDIGVRMMYCLPQMGIWSVDNSWLKPLRSLYMLLPYFTRWSISVSDNGPWYIRLIFRRKKYIAAEVDHWLSCDAGGKVRMINSYKVSGAFTVLAVTVDKRDPEHSWSAYPYHSQKCKV